MGSIISPSSQAYETFEEGSEILAAHGYDINLLRLCVEQDEPIVGQLHNQLAIFANNYAAELQLKDELGVKPDHVAGHSVGEYNAYTGAAVLNYSYALPLVAERASAMAQAGVNAREPGGLAVISRLDLETVEQLARKNAVQIGNYNNPEQTTVTGTLAQLRAVGEDIEKLKEEPANSRIRFIPIKNVDVAVHSRWMGPAARRLRQFIEPGMFFEPYGAEVLLNINGKVALSGGQIAELAPDQLTNPVRWQEDMEVAVGLRDYEGNLRQPGEDERVIIVEVGYGTVLTGINRYLKSDRVRVVSYQDALKYGLDWQEQAA